MKGSKKYNSYEYAAVNEYLPKALTNEVTNGTTTKKPRFGKRKQGSTKPYRFKSTKIEHDYE